MAHHRPMQSPPPLPIQGAARALRLWKVALAVWVVPAVLFLPATVAVQVALGPALGRLPASEEVPPGDLALIVMDGLRGMAPPVLLTLIGGCALHWLWTLLWHGGVARWQHQSDGDAPRLSAVLGLGCLSLARSICLSVTAALGFVLMAVPAWLVLWLWSSRQYRSMNDGPLFWGWMAGTLLTGLVTALSWAATLRGFWLLTGPARCSPVAAWLRGLAASLLQPLPTIATLLLWTVPAVGLSLAPLLTGWWLEVARGGLVGALVSAVAGALRAFCWVALFVSFAPTTGKGPRRGLRAVGTDQPPAAPSPDAGAATWRP